MKDGLLVIQDIIEKIHDSIAYWSATPSRVEKIKEMARQIKIPCIKKLSLDCKIYCNSTYLMLQTALKYKDVFPRLKLKEKHYTSMPSQEEWKLAQVICLKLKLFYKATKLFFDSKYPTINIYFIKICQVRKALSKWMTSSNEVISTMAIKVFEKFEKY